MSRLEKAGYRFEMLRPDEIGEELRRSSRRLGGVARPLARARLHDGDGRALRLPGHAGRGRARRDGRVGGFLQLVPSPACGGYSLASMRRRRDTPNGLMEFLIVETIDWARAHEVQEVSLNFSVFAEYLRADRKVLRAAAAAARPAVPARAAAQLQPQVLPEWRRRYFCFERWTDLPLAALAYLHAESLLTPPGPWAAKTPDLTAR